MSGSLAILAVLTSQHLASPPPAAQRYALTARLSFAEEARDSCELGPERWPDDGFIAPINRGLRVAFDRTVQRMFRPAPAAGDPADVEIEISTACAEIIRDISGSEVVIQAHARIVNGGKELDRLFLRSEEPLLPGVGREGIARAADRAVALVAASLEPAFVNSEPVVAWLIGRDIQPVGSTEVWPRRGDWNFFADVAGGVITGGGEESAVSLLAHSGVAHRWFLLQGVFGTWAPSFMAAPSDSGTADVRLPATLRTFDLGMEAGPILRFGPAFELRSGLGAHLLAGRAGVSPRPESSSFTHFSPTLFAALQTSRFPSETGRRIRFGIEVRKYLQTTVSLPELSRTVPVADLGIIAYLGLEWPLRDKR